MRKKMLLIAVVLVVVSLCGSSAFGIAPVGPPTASLKTGQWSTGFDYAHGEIDFEIDWSSDTAGVIPTYLSKESSAKDMESDAYLAKFGYGISDDWELYGFLGAANNKGDIEDEGSIANGSVNFDGGHNFSGGFGTKWTFLKDEQASWGIVYQMSWSSGDDSYDDVDLTGLGGSSAETVDVDIDSFDITLMVGPTYEMGNWRIYGGAGLYYYDADIDVEAMNTTAVEGDVDEAMFGGYVGTEVDIDESCSFYGEYMLANDAWAIGTGIVWRF